MQIERNVLAKTGEGIGPQRAEAGKREGTDEVDFRVRVSGDLSHRSGYVQSDEVKNLIFTGATSRRIRLAPGAYSLTVFVGAGYGKENVDYAVEFVTGPLVLLRMPGRNPIRAQTVGSTGFVVIDFTLY